MGWPSIPGILYTDSVTHYAVTHGKDAASGKTQTRGNAGGSYPCAVIAASANDIAVHSRESMTVSHVVVCDSKIGTYRDVLVWAETGATLTILSIEPAGDGRGRIWNHYCEEQAAS